MATISWEEQQSGLDQRDGQMFGYDFSCGREALTADSLIHLNHTVMSLNDDYAGSNDEGSAGGSVLILKHRKKAHSICAQNTADEMSGLASPTFFIASALAKKKKGKEKGKFSHRRGSSTLCARH